MDDPQHVCIEIRMLRTSDGTCSLVQLTCYVYYRIDTCKNILKCCAIIKEIVVHDSNNFIRDFSA